MISERGFFENLGPEGLSEENGLQRVEFLNQEFGKDAIDDLIEKWDDSCKKKESQCHEE